ncbi:hypothetical protein TNCV_4436851 [Trichonephila clavipes]|nr:hypothetical protein TNCV_4436851 [Trichonephila clavipes]
MSCTPLACLATRYFAYRVRPGLALTRVEGPPSQIGGCGDFYDYRGSSGDLKVAWIEETFNRTQNDYKKVPSDRRSDRGLEIHHVKGLDVSLRTMQKRLSKNRSPSQLTKSKSPMVRKEVPLHMLCKRSLPGKLPSAGNPTTLFAGMVQSLFTQEDVLPTPVLCISKVTTVSIPWSLDVAAPATSVECIRRKTIAEGNAADCKR